MILLTEHHPIAWGAIFIYSKKLIIFALVGACIFILRLFLVLEKVEVLHPRVMSGVADRACVLRFVVVLDTVADSALRVNFACRFK